MAETPFSGERQAVINRIREWVLLPREGIRYRFAHLQVPPGLMDQSTTDESVPTAIWKEITDTRPKAGVIHITHSHKALEGVLNRTDFWRQIASGVSDRGGLDMGTQSYHECLMQMRSSDFPQVGSAPPDDEFSRLSDVLFVVDIDSDFPVDLSLLLVALLPWVASKSAVVPGVRFGLLTMSSDPLHPFVQCLFQIHEDCPTSQFQMLAAGDSQGETVEVALAADMMSAMVRKAATLNPDSSQTVVSFQAWRATHLQGWTSETINFDTFDRDQCVCNHGERRIVWHCEAVRVPERMVRSDYVHIFTSNSRLRRIFDRKTNHIVAVNVKVSASEQRDQLSWANRADTRQSKVILYKQPGHVVAAGPRRLDIAGHQLAGFLAGLAELADWPIQADRVMEGLGRVDQAALRETKRWLVEQNLVGFDGPTSAPVLALPHAAHPAFFAVLPLVKYDARLARFLSESIRSPRATLVKVQVATLLTFGIDKLVHINTAKTTAKEVLEYSSFGLVGPLSGCGTMWLFLNLVKRAIAEKDPDNKTPGPVLTALGGAVSINSHGTRHFSHLMGVLRDTLLALDIDTTFMDPGAETGFLTEAEFMDVLWDFLRAFVQQTCTTSGPEHGASKILDVVSRQEMDQHELALWAIRWDLIKQKDVQTRCSTGVYTRLTRGPGHPRVTLRDWNWIPLHLLLRWKREMKPLHELKGPRPHGSNADEL